MSEWISVNDALPFDGSEAVYDTKQVIVSTSSGVVMCVECKTGNGGREGGRWQQFDADLVTHWMPLPEPPEAS